MARRVLIALFLAFAPAPAWALAAPANDASQTVEWRMTQPTGFEDYESRARGNSMFAGTEVGPNATFGLGIFGLRPERTRQAPFTVRELDAPHTRRAGVGVRLKF